MTADTALTKPHRHRYGLTPVWTADGSRIDSWWWCTDHPAGGWVRIEDDEAAIEAGAFVGREPEGAPPIDRKTLAAALEAAFPVPASYEEWQAQADRSYLSDADAILAALPSRPSPSDERPDGLDAAWAEAEAALPEGWVLELGNWQAEPNRPEGLALYEATAEPYANRLSEKIVIGRGERPAEAVRQLAAALAEAGR